MPKSPDQAITFLHCCLSGNATSSHSRIFSHLRCHFRNLWYRPSFTVQSILGPSIYSMNIPGITYGCCLGWLNVTPEFVSWSEFGSSSWLVYLASCWADAWASSWAELLLALGFMVLYVCRIGMSKTVLKLFTVCKLDASCEFLLNICVYVEIFISVLAECTLGFPGTLI